MAGTALIATLSSVSSPVSPTQAGVKAWVAAYNQANRPNLNPTQQKVLTIVNLLVQVRQGTIGAAKDYTPVGVGHARLISDAKAFTTSIGNFDMTTALQMVGIAAAQTGVVINDMNTAMTTGRDFLALPEETLDRIIAMLLFDVFL